MPKSSDKRWMKRLQDFKELDGYALDMRVMKDEFIIRNK